MIQSFSDTCTEKIFEGKSPKGFPQDIIRRAIIKLDQLHSAASLDDLRIPPSNHLEALKRDRIGQHSIRINKQWRLCFRWENGNAYEVTITDYH